jgi:hypothetical protein
MKSLNYPGLLLMILSVFGLVGLLAMGLRFEIPQLAVALSTLYGFGYGTVRAFNLLK